MSEWTDQPADVGGHEERFRLVSEHSPIGIFQVAPNGYCTWMNERMCEIFGFGLKDGLGFGYAKYFHPDDVPQLAEVWTKHASQNAPTPKFAYRILTHDRKVKWVSIQAAPLQDNTGKVVAYVGTLEDITELKTNQDELLESQQQLEKILNNMPEGVFFLDNDWMFTYVNENAAKILRLTEEQLLGKNMWEMFPEAVGTAFQEQYLRSKLTNQPFHFTDFYPPLDMWVKLTGIPNRDGFLVYLRNVSEEKELAHHIDRIYEMSPAILGIVNEDMHFAQFNPALGNILGYTDDELKAKPFYEFVHPDDGASVLKAAKLIMKTGGYNRNFENRYIAKDGSPKWISWSVYGHPERKLAYFVAHNITEKKALETERAHYQEQLEHTVQQRTAELTESNHELEAFNYTVSHDLRTPIRAIQMFASLLERECSQQQVCDEFIQNIKACTVEMTSLINDLLELSKIRRKELVFSKVDMAGLVKDVAQYLVSLEERKDIDIKIGKLHAANGDKTTLRSVWQNLISNALKYSKKDTPISIAISSRKKEDVVEYCIADNGVGFDMRYADKLFKPFSRLHSSTDYKGTGAGLAIVSRIIVRHGGGVRAESVPWDGSKFYFTLPNKQ